MDDSIINFLWDVLSNVGVTAFIGSIAGIVAILVAVVALLRWMFFRKPKPIVPEAPLVQVSTSPILEKATVTLHLDEYEARLNKREAEVRAELAIAPPEDRARLENQAAELKRKQSDLEGSLKEREAKIAELEALLGNAETEDEREAKAALDAGDLEKAAEIFARIEARGDLEVDKTAKAAFAQGEIAEEQVRWADAAVHYAKAARLKPGYVYCRKAANFLDRAGQFDQSLLFGDQMISYARSEFGEETLEHATALNNHAATLRALGKYAEAEPLYHQALAIDEKTLGVEHPHHATRLNNLAELFHDTGRFEEAEPLYRQALAIGEKTLGVEHPAYAIRLNNLAGLLKHTGRFDEAEPLYRQVLAIDEKTLGGEHPAYAIRLNNLALLLKDSGRFEEAEPLYRQALAIDEKTLGVEHPDYATDLNNLAVLLHNTGRSAEAEPLMVQAVGIREAKLGVDHPNSKSTRKNLEVIRAKLAQAEE